ncbi:MAG: alpha-hydroxy acid oxidase [Sphingomonadaceae bacterium]
MTSAQFNGTPKRSYETTPDLSNVVSVEDLRAKTHKLMPRFVLEYLEGGAGEEATLVHERESFSNWCFMPHTLVDESNRSVAVPILGKTAEMPLVVAPTGLNAVFRHHGDIELATGAARCGVPFTQSTMSNDPMEDVAQVPGLRHWWQLYVFGGDEIWQELVDRAAKNGCEALVLTTNSQIFGRREWDQRARTSSGFPNFSSIFDAALHPRWLAKTMLHGMPQFANVIDFIPKDRRSFFDSANWIREQMPRSLSWDDVAKIRDRWRGPFFIKGILNLQDVRHARDSGVDGIVLGTHGGRQGDWEVSALDILEEARKIVGPEFPLFMSGGVRRGSDILKARALGADAVMTGRAMLYGLCAFGADGVAKAIQLLRDEMMNEIGQIGLASLDHISADIMVSKSKLPLSQ